MSAGFRAVAFCDRMATENGSGLYESYLSEMSVREPGRLLTRRLRPLCDNRRSQDGSGNWFRQQWQTTDSAAAVCEQQSSNTGQPLSNQPFGQNSQPFGQNNKDVYATRIGDDFDDVLTFPQAPMNYSTTVEPAPIFEDVFTALSQDQTSVYDFPVYDKTTPIDSFTTSTTRQRQTQDYTEPSETEFMGWPVLPENSADEEETAGNNRGDYLRASD